MPSSPSRRRSISGRADLYAPLEPAGLLVPADSLAGPRPALDAGQLAGAVVPVGFCGRKLQHRQIIRLGFHPTGQMTLREDAVHARQAVAGDVEQQVML